MPILGNIGTTEWIIIGILILVFFGSNKLKEFARGLGESGKELKKIKKEFYSVLSDIKEEDTPNTPKVNKK